MTAEQKVIDTFKLQIEAALYNSEDIESACEFIIERFSAKHPEINFQDIYDHLYQDMYELSNGECIFIEERAIPGMMGEPMSAMIITNCKGESIDLDTIKPLLKSSDLKRIIQQLDNIFEENHISALSYFA